MLPYLIQQFDCLYIDSTFSKVIMQCYVTHCNFCISNKAEYVDNEQLKKFYQRSYFVISSDLCNVIKKILDKISFYTHFKDSGHSTFADNRSFDHDNHILYVIYLITFCTFYVFPQPSNQIKTFSKCR